jgi:NTE family protein
VFDSYVDELTPDHILASGSLPPGFPWTEIDGRVYWDGGIISNSPLDMVIDRCGPDGKRVFIVDLFAGQRPLPANIMEVMARRDEIVYSERVRSDLRLRELTSGYRGLVDGLMELMDPDAASRIRQRPLYIELMGDGARMDVTRFVRVGRTGEPSSRDYDFSDIAVADNIAQGYALVRQQLEARRPHAAMLDSAAPPRPTRPQMQKGALASLAESDRLVDEVDAAARRAPGTRDR